jgi:signal transduction histidine kinase
MNLDERLRRTRLVLAAGIVGSATVIAASTALASWLMRARVDWPAVTDRFVWWASWLVLLVFLTPLARLFDEADRRDPRSASVAAIMARAAAVFLTAEMLRLFCRIAVRAAFDPWGQAVRWVVSFRSVVVGDFAIGMLLIVTLAFVVLETRAVEATAAAADAARRVDEARRLFLAEQLKPHFLFNALNGVIALMRDDPPGAKAMLRRLTQFVALSFERDLSALTSVAEEVEVARAYADIQEQRFENRLQVRFEIDPAALDCAIPPFLLQPLIENAAQHGLAGGLPGAIGVHVRRDGDTLRVEVESSGRGYPATMIERIGIGNTRNRLEAIFRGAARFQLERTADGGTMVSVTLPASAVS